MIETLLYIEGKIGTRSFAGGLVAQNGKVVEVAPILRRHIQRGWTGAQVAAYCKAQGWHWEVVHRLTSGLELARG
jgi:hypothetical protein